MGPSGSGKTTLLDVLAGRKTVGEIQGDVLFAGTQPSTAFLRRYTGYVEQFDTLIDVLTVCSFSVLSPQAFDAVQLFCLFTSAILPHMFSNPNGKHL
jgi:ABC-type lipoprotein export system ATPase subunit